MLITGYENETWTLMNRGVDPASGQDMVHVRRVGIDARACVWRLVRYPNGWRNVGQYIGSLPGYRPTPEKRGKLLSNSRIDLTLRSFAESGHANLYA